MTEEVLFNLALNTPECERSALLERECAGDQELRSRVEALLRADDRSDLTVDVQGPTIESFDEPIGARGTVIAGKYKRIEAIGEGGMGTVWLAQQTEPVKRRVAVKLIKPGMDSRAVLARYRPGRNRQSTQPVPEIRKDS